MIVEACGEGTDPARIEEMMRIESGGCLDGLDRRQFFALARRSAKAVRFLDSPEGQEFTKSMNAAMGIDI